MAEDHGASEAGQLSGSGQKSYGDRESPESECHKDSVARQCRMR